MCYSILVSHSLQTCLVGKFIIPFSLLNIQVLNDFSTYIYYYRLPQICLGIAANELFVV